MKNLIVIIVLFLGTILNVQAADLQNDAALDGVTNTNAVFDISPGGRRLLGQLNVIYKTYEQLVAFGQKPKFVRSIPRRSNKIRHQRCQICREKGVSNKEESATKNRRF